jgi:hypothetical protein
MLPALALAPLLFAPSHFFPLGWTCFVPLITSLSLMYPRRRTAQCLFPILLHVAPRTVLLAPLF